MANIVSLHKRQLFLPSGSVAEFAKVYFYLSGTSTQVDTYADVDLLTQNSQPLVCDANGVMPPAYVASGAPLRILATDQDDVALDGYPMDNIVPELAEALDASGVAFLPTESVPENNVQDAIVSTAALFSDQSTLFTRYFALQSTGGTSDAYTITPTPAVTAYASGLSYMVMPNRANTGAATLNVNGVGAVNLMKMGTAGTPVALAANEIQPYREFRVTYDGTRFLMTLGRDFPLRGGSAGTSPGSWLKVGGELICRIASFQLDFISTSAVGATWTFPATFASAEYTLTGSISSSSAAAPTRAMLGPIYPNGTAGKTTTSVQVRVSRHNGTTDFVTNDVLLVDLTAIGSAA